MDKKLRNISSGCRINDKIFSKIVRRARRHGFVTERDIARFIKAEFKRAGAGPAFPPIVAIGKNAVDWHHRPTNAKLAGGGFCVIDFGARVNSYCSDMTRTIHFGRAAKSGRALYKKVLRANVLCTGKIRAGIDGHEVYMHARKTLGKHAKYFGHGLGHGLKKIIHARPRLGRKEGHFLREGDIVTIEPGVYIPRRLGIRIEDDVLVTAKGRKLLSKSTKKLVEIREKSLEK
ncbi:MAG: M24 family metallopeptidase [Candidatus Diapherotrites archaeon]|uniref:M24 family metallopeptidase n=1 Tax=Candidatus Iainarchaeum sp. TaxID=3101447 RepID=A0A8T3YJZ9_9ARCH|nr:M24 family metallopeptidase [Candidatus Diapherotrites archaeon]